MSWKSMETNLDGFQAIFHCVTSADVILQHAMELCKYLIERRQYITVGFFDWIQIEQRFYHVEIYFG